MDEVAMDDEAGTCMALKKALVGLQATNAKHIEDGVNSLKKEGVTASSTKATDELRQCEPWFAIPKNLLRLMLFARPVGSTMQCGPSLLLDGWSTDKD